MLDSFTFKHFFSVETQNPVRGLKKSNVGFVFGLMHNANPIKTCILSTDQKGATPPVAKKKSDGKSKAIHRVHFLGKHRKRKLI